MELNKITHKGTLEIKNDLTPLQNLDNQSGLDLPDSALNCTIR
jgi:hypothetical protein